MDTRLLALLDKEWTDALKNRYVLFLCVILPLVFVLLPTIVLYSMARLPPRDLQRQTGNLPPGWQRPEWRDLTGLELIQVAVGQEFSLLFLVVPLAIPMTIATYGVIGEKRERSLEPLLATPITTAELLLGKSIAAAAPGVAITWGCALLFALAARVVLVSARAYSALLNPAWVLTIVLLAPLLTVLATIVGLIISSRANDPRFAEQIGMVVILPILGLFFAQMAGVLTLSPLIVLLIAIGLAAVDAGLLAVGAGVFQREAILTRWK